MTPNFDFLFNYLEKENIPYNKAEFLFQIQSHPNYPNILSISDTLSFFNIDNGLIKVPFSDIESLPTNFVALLKLQNNDGSNKTEPIFITKNGNYYHSLDDKKIKILDSEKLISLWGGIVFLVEKSDDIAKIEIEKNIFWRLLLITYFGVLLIIIYYISPNWQSCIFFIFPLLGLVFSLGTLKDLLGIKSELFNSFCNITASTSCKSVIESNKWNIFRFISFSDLSVVFFAFQLMSLLLFFLRSDTTAYFNMQKMILICSLPFLLTSLYYQKFVEKKWCPICLGIIGVLLSEFVFISIFYPNFFNFQIYSLIFLVFIFITAAFFWYIIKKVFIKLNQLKESQMKANRFMRNYELFKNTLLASSPIKNFPVQCEEDIILGNPNANLKIIVVTSAFCGFCANTHKIIEEIIEKSSEKVCFNIYFNFNYNKEDDKSRKIYLQLLTIYFNQGQKAFMKALHQWFENKNEKELNVLANSSIRELNLILEKQSKWCQYNNINYTPEIIVNGYFFPKQYDRSDLLHFINELYEDEDFMLHSNKQ